ncbi:MAG: hypothetical protein IPI29_08525 [Ignavibacteria bacterium]|nr:hypothetical protein [Ignavibacteria bacterium]
MTVSLEWRLRPAIEGMTHLSPSLRVARMGFYPSHASFSWYDLLWLALCVTLRERLTNCKPIVNVHRQCGQVRVPTVQTSECPADIPIENDVIRLTLATHPRPSMPRALVSLSAHSLH